MSRRRRSVRPRRGGSGGTLASAFVLSLMLVILIFTQRQIANGVVEAFNAMTVVEGSADESSADDPGDEVPSQQPVRSTTVEFFDEADTLAVELARARVQIALARGRTSLEESGDQHIP